MHTIRPCISVSFDWRFLFPLLLGMWLINPGQGWCSSYNSNEVSWRQTVSIYQRVPCLTSEQEAYGKEVLRGLPYIGRRAFRRVALSQGVTFEKSQLAWEQLLWSPLSYEQLLSFEQWSETGAMHVDLALKGLKEIKTLGYEAGKSFQLFVTLPDTSPKLALQSIGLFNNLNDANNNALQQILTIPGIKAQHIFEIFPILARLTQQQARACQSFAATTAMQYLMVRDGLYLLRQLQEDSAINANWVFKTENMSANDAWKWLTGYLALPLGVRQQQFRQLATEEKQTLLRSYHRGAEQILWKVNNLHAVTDRFGMEISAGRLSRIGIKELRQQFEHLSAKTRFRFGESFYAQVERKNTNKVISLLREATAADRKQIVKELELVNIYALLSRGSELYDSSFRDIIIPIFKERLDHRFKGDLLKALVFLDPTNILIADFIVSCAQKGKLTIFFPDEPKKQQEILRLVAASALKDEDSILLFSATFTHLLGILQPEARSFIIARMAERAGSATPIHALLISTILQYYQQENAPLLQQKDLNLIATLAHHHQNIDFNRYQSTPFVQWKTDDRLTSLSLYHPDDDGRASFVSNTSLLLKNGYSLKLTSPYTLYPVGKKQLRLLQQNIAATNTSGKGLSKLFYQLEKTGAAIVLEKKINGIQLSHNQVVYSGKARQQEVLIRFFERGDEMLAQRGHSYWRGEQLTEPLTAILGQSRISKNLLNDKQRFVSLGSCGGVKAYTNLSRLFDGSVDILATIGTGLASINDPYNKNLFEIIAAHPENITWKTVARESAFIFQSGRGQDYLQPGSLTAVLHKILDEEKNKTGHHRAQPKT